MSNLLLLIKKHQNILAQVVLLCIYIFLVYQDPFSERSLVANLGPFPDVFHYILPARCFIDSFSWTLCRPGLTGYAPSVGPLYSVLLIPVFLLKNDPRMFYYLNVLLGIVTLFFTYKTVREISKSTIVSFSIALLLLTTYHFTWLPTLAMAENAILPLFILAVYSSLFPQSKLFKIYLPFISFGFVLAKFAYIPLTAVFLMYWLYRMTVIEKSIPKMISAGLILISILLAAWYGFIKTDLGTNFFTLSPTEEQLQHSWFSLHFVPKNIEFYTQAFLGKPLLVIWDIRPLVSLPLSLIGILGALLSLFQKKLRVVGILIISSLAAQIAFMSTFYAADGRYFIIALPSILISISFVYRWATTRTDKVKLAQSIVLLIAILSVGFQAKELKTKLAINFKYAETPWFYVATKHIEKSIEADKNTVLISAIPVYFFDFYSQSKYQILPIAQEQEPKTKPLVYGPEYNYENLIVLYKKLVADGKSVYISNYGLGNQGYMHEAYDQIENSFELELVTEGCFQSCNVYKLTSFESSQ